MTESMAAKRRRREIKDLQRIELACRQWAAMATGELSRAAQLETAENFRSAIEKRPPD
jgi:hypothetical protein